MQTKAELEAEIARLRERVAELEGAVAAYQYALAQKPAEPFQPYWPNTQFPTWTWVNDPLPGTFPAITLNNNTE